MCQGKAVTKFQAPESVDAFLCYSTTAFLQVLTSLLPPCLLSLSREPSKTVLCTGRTPPGARARQLLHLGPIWVILLHNNTLSARLLSKQNTEGQIKDIPEVAWRPFFLLSLHGRFWKQRHAKMNINTLAPMTTLAGTKRWLAEVTAMLSGKCILSAGVCWIWKSGRGSEHPNPYLLNSSLNFLHAPCNTARKTLCEGRKGPPGTASSGWVRKERVLVMATSNLGISQLFEAPRPITSLIPALRTSFQRQKHTSMSGLRALPEGGELCCWLLSSQHKGGKIM